MLQVILLFSFITAVLFLYPVLKLSYGKQKAINRLKRYINTEELREERKKSNRKEFKAGFSIIAKGVGSMKFLDGYKKAVQVRLNRAHVLLKAEEFVSVSLLLFLFLAALLFLISRSVFAAIGAGVAGWIIPGIILSSKIKKRVKHLNEQLGDAIVLISNSLKAGYSFFQSLDIVVKEMTGPITEEFSLLQKEINLGTNTEKALENLVQRVCSDDLELVVTAVLIQRQVGGNLAEVLDNISSTIRDRVKIKGEVRTVTAQGRMSGLIISILPFGLGLLIFLINPEHIGILFKSTLGMAIVGFSVLMQLIGIYFINKIIKIEV